MTTATAGILIEKYLSWESSELASDILLNGLVSTQGEAVSSQRTSQTSTINCTTKCSTGTLKLNTYYNLDHNYYYNQYRQYKQYYNSKL